MRCPRCLNEDDSYFYLGSKGWMCRKCISFKRILILEELEMPVGIEPKDDCGEYVLRYPLTSLQQIVSDNCAKLVLDNDILIEAICGARQNRVSFCNYF